jgi:hypothetical protein
VFALYPERIEIVLGAWIALISSVQKEYLGTPDEAMEPSNDKRHDRMLGNGQEH